MERLPRSRYIVVQMTRVEMESGDSAGRLHADSNQSPYCLPAVDL